MKIYLYNFITVVSLFAIAPLIASAATYVNEKFVPFRGESHIIEDATSRYTLQYSAWNDAGKEAYTSLNDTYEHETIFYNYDGNAYATTTLSNTKGTGWDTSFPDPYLDTQFADDPNEPNLAVGTFDPDLITTLQWYYSWVRLNSTASNQSFYKINGQKGYSLCELGAWCVENEQTAILIPFKSPFTAPESARNYRYEYDNNTDGQNYTANLSFGWWGTGVISSTSDQDYFYQNIPNSRTVNFILKQAQFKNGEDYDVQIYDTNWNLVAASYNGTGVDEIFSAYLNAGNYFVRIYPYNGSNAILTYNFIAY